MANDRNLQSIKECRRKRLSALLDEYGKVGLSRLVDISADYLWQMGKGVGISARGVSDSNAAKIETALGKPPGWMGSGRDESTPLQQSHPLRLEPETLAETVRTLRERLGDAGKVCDLIEHQPHLFMRAYELYANSTKDERTPEQERALAMKVADLTPQGAKKDERGKKVPIEGSVERRVGDRRKREA